MDLARQLIGIAVVLGLLAWILWILRKKGFVAGVPAHAGKHRRVQLLERVPLTSTHSVHLIRAGGRTILLAVHSSGVTVLCDVQEET